MKHIQERIERYQATLDRLEAIQKELYDIPSLLSSEEAIKVDIARYKREIASFKAML